MLSSKNGYGHLTSQGSYSQHLPVERDDVVVRVSSIGIQAQQWVETWLLYRDKYQIL